MQIYNVDCKETNTKEPQICPPKTLNSINQELSTTESKTAPKKVPQMASLKRPKIGAKPGRPKPPSAVFRETSIWDLRNQKLSKKWTPKMAPILSPKMGVNFGFSQKTLPKQKLTPIFGLKIGSIFGSPFLDALEIANQKMLKFWNPKTDPI